MILPKIIVFLLHYCYIVGYGNDSTKNHYILP
jgi:hypothetical protein